MVGIVAFFAAKSPGWGEGWSPRSPMSPDPRYRPGAAATKLFARYPFHGETPLDEYESLCRKHLEWASANRVQQGVLLARGHLAVAHAMQGDFESARGLMHELSQIIEGREPSITGAMDKAEGWGESRAWRAIPAAEGLNARGTRHSRRSVRGAARPSQVASPA